MKKIILYITGALIGTLIGVSANAQNGLENIIVEKYYVSNAADAALSSGTLPTGSVTYRFYADLLPGYKLQAVYGVNNHPLKFVTTTSFFNNEDNGNTTPSFNYAQADDNSTMLDSWLSVGAACNGYFGVLKTEDNGVNNVSNADGILANNDASAGIPLTTQDGLLAGAPQTVQFVGLTSELNVFDATSQVGGSFITTNGSIASLTGSTGPTATNRVLIAQITTNGILSYELNLQVISSSNAVQNFVALNPTGSEIALSSLSGTLGATLATQPATSGAITFGTSTAHSIPVNFTSGSGAKRMVICRQGAAVNFTPVDGSTYIANSNFASGAQLGTGNYVVYNGTGNSVTVTGLNTNTLYHFTVVEYNDNNQAGAENYKTTTNPSASKATSSVATTYQWSQTGSGPFNFNDAANWTPSRVTPATDDILVFSNGAAGTLISNVPSQTVGQVLVSTNTSIKMQGTSSSTLTIAGNTAADDFKVEAGSTMEFNGFTPVSILLNSGALGSVFGNIIVSSNNSIVANTASGLKFKSGSVYTANTGITTAPFGSASGVTNSVVFESGSTFTVNAAGMQNPFQKTAPLSLVVFNTGSTQNFNSTAGFEAEGRTYANLNISKSISSSLTSTFLVENLTLTSTGSLSLTGTGTSSIEIKGDVLNNASGNLSVTSGTGGVKFSKVGTQLLGGSGAGQISVLGLMNILASSTVNMSKSISVNDLTIAGKLKFNAANLVANISGTITNSGQILPFGTSDASLNFTAGAGSNLGTLGVCANLKNLTVDRSTKTLTLSSAVNAYGAVTVQAGTVASAGFLTLKSTATSTAYISGAGSADVTGNVTVERYINGTGTVGVNHYLSCPVTGKTTNTAWGANFPVNGTFPYIYGVNPTPTVFPTVWSLNETLNAWQSANTVSLNAMDGIVANTLYAQSIVLKPNGPVNNNTVTRSITKNGNGSNLVGNPYPSPILWSKVLLLNPTLNSTYYTWSASNNNYGYSNGTVGTFGVKDTIYSSQGILVNTNASATLTMNNSVRVGTTSSSFFRTSNNVSNVYHLNLTNGTSKQQIAFYTETEGVDSYNANKDAIVVEVADARALDMFIELDSKKIAIKELSEMTSIDKVLPLNVFAQTAGNYTFELASLKDKEQNVTAYLVDNLLGTKVELTANAKYNVSLVEGYNASRFFINISKENSTSTTGVATVNSSNGVSVNAVNGQLNILTDKVYTNAVVEISDVAGKLILTEKVGAINAGTTTVDLSSAITMGNYIVKMSSTEGTFVNKLIIK